MTTTTELETLKKVREEYHASSLPVAGKNKILTGYVLAGEILPWAHGQVERKIMRVNLAVINDEIEQVENEQARTAKTAPALVKMCPKHHIQLTLGRCDECDDWDN